MSEKKYIVTITDDYGEDFDLQELLQDSLGGAISVTVKEV